MARRLLIALALLLAPACSFSAPPTPPPASKPGGAWNADQIAWQPYAAGLAQAQAQSKPVLLVVSASWCPHCRNYSRVFDDPRVVTAARDFVMIHLDEDQEPDAASKYREDGAYVPRTYFLQPGGAIADVHATNPRYRFFYEEANPNSLLAGMTAAKAKAAPN